MWRRGHSGVYGDSGRGYSRAATKGDFHVTLEFQFPPRRLDRGRFRPGAVGGDAGLRAGRPPAAPRPKTTSRTSSSPRPCARPRCSTCPSRSTPRPRRTSSARARNTIEDLSRNVAGLTIQNLGPGQSQVSVRGVSAGQIVRDQPGVKEQVGVYLDDSVISLSLFTPDLDLFDLNRVETLRGPQGTLFGAGSVGGTLRYITNQPDARPDSRASIEANINLVAGDDFGGHLKGMVNVPLGDSGGDPRGRLSHRIWRLHRRARRRRGGENVNGGHRTGGRHRAALRAGRRHLDHAARPLSADPRQRLQPAGGLQPLRQSVHHRPRPAVDRSASASNICCCASGSRTTPSSPTSTSPSISARSTADLGLAPTSTATSWSAATPARSPARSRSISASRRRRCCCRRTWSTRPTSRPSPRRSASPRTTAGRSSGCSAPSIRNVDRFYRQRLPTPGYDASTDARFGAGTAVAVRNGFPANSPYNADLPYDIRQTAIFGEASYDFTQRLRSSPPAAAITTSRRSAQFNSGGLFSNGDNNIDETSSSGFSPRVIASYEAGRQCPGQRPGLEGLPARRRQRSAQHPALHRRRERRRRADLRQSSDL